MRLRLPRHGTVAAYAALFVALGGTSYAVTRVNTGDIATHAVTGSKIANGAITPSKIRDGAVRSAQVKDGSLSAKDFAAGQLPAGPQGPAGPAGPAAAVGYANIAGNGAVDPATSHGIASANVVHQIQGSYCLSGLATAPKNVQVTAQLGFNGPVVPDVALGAAAGCPTGTQVSILLQQSGSLSAIDNAFFVLIN